PFVLCMFAPPPRSTLFPSPTLFRSALGYLLDLGIADVSARIVALGAGLRDRLSAIPGVRVTDSGHERGGIVTCTVDGRSAFEPRDRKSTRLNSSHRTISYAVFCLKK